MSYLSCCYAIGAEPQVSFRNRLHPKKRCPIFNRLIVGGKSELLASACRVTDINWIGEEPSGPLEISTRVRYRSQEVPSTLIPQDNKAAIVRFDAPQSAITPGQGAVFYRGDEILGGGWIEKSMAHRAESIGKKAGKLGS
jgi:tRNA U34 2-thiouridine synthase MnmA/TrmU